jgi:hypothetical protein
MPFNGRCRLQRLPARLAHLMWRIVTLQVGDGGAVEVHPACQVACGMHSMHDALHHLNRMVNLPLLPVSYTADLARISS